jgi:hypothetical protein
MKPNKLLFYDYIQSHLLAELETELQIISFEYDNPITMSDKSISTAIFTFNAKRGIILENEFESQEDEIIFSNK